MDRRGNISLRESLDASLVAMPRGQRIEHVATAERRLTAEDHPVAPRCNHRRCETELREAVAEAHDPRRGVRRAEVHLHARVVLDRRDLLERDVEPIRRRIPTRLDERISPCDVAPIDAGKAHRDALARLGSLDVAVVHLDAPHSDVAAGRLEPQLISCSDRARPERSRNDRAEAGNGERAIDVEPRRAVGALVLDGVGDSRERGAELVETFARARAHAHDLGSRDELDRLGLGELDRLVVDGIDLRQRDDTVLDPEQTQDREVLVRLRARALTRIDHEQEQIDPGRAGDHRAHEALVARNVDHGEPAPVGKLERRIAEIDRDPASPLLGQPVRVLPRQRSHEPRLAVVDVTRGADRQRHVRGA